VAVHRPQWLADKKEVQQRCRITRENRTAHCSRRHPAAALLWLQYLRSRDFGVEGQPGWLRGARRLLCGTMEEKASIRTYGSIIAVPLKKVMAACSATTAGRVAIRRQTSLQTVRIRQNQIDMGNSGAGR